MIDVLFVDDEIKFAEAWSQRISRTMRLNAKVTSDPSEALAIARDIGIKVAVIDQVLDGTGTDGVTLGISITQVDPRIRWILLSGEATGEQITQAYDSGLRSHIHKNDALDKLPPAIRRYLVEYDEAIARSVDLAGSPLLVAKARITDIKKYRLISRQTVKYFLLAVDSVDREFTPDDEWVSSVQLSSGEEREESFELGWTRTETVNYSRQSNVGTEVQLATPQLLKLNASLRSEIVQKENLTSVVSSQRSYKLVRRLRLPTEPQDPTVLHVGSRHFEVAPVYVKVDVTLLARCSCCGHDEAIKGSTVFPRDRFATRQTDILSDGTRKVTRTDAKAV